MKVLKPLLNDVRKVLRGSPVLLMVLFAGTGKATPPDSTAVPENNLHWEFSMEALSYVRPVGEDVPVLTATADFGSIHLESRYNYEDLKSASIFAGWTFSMGESCAFALTPMAGVAFGRTTGFVPALEASIEYGVFDWYVESEYFLDVDEPSEGFFYSWLELGVAPFDLLRLGAMTQWTKSSQNPLEFDGGPFVQLTPAQGTVSVYALNLFTDSWFVVVGLEIVW
jgi:hypothetical protein